MSEYERSAIDNILLARDGVTLCDDGAHDWVSIGGRACPHKLTENCSQAVFRCRGCGDYDYGEQGGPGQKDCASRCHVSEIRAGNGISRQQRRRQARQRQKGYTGESVYGRPNAHPDRDVQDIRFLPFKPGEEPREDEHWQTLPF